jgi:hypothetical protein
MNKRIRAKVQKKFERKHSVIENYFHGEGSTRRKLWADLLWQMDLAYDYAMYRYLR